MDKKAALAAIASAVVALVTALGTHGADAFKALAGLPVMLQAWASGLPLGLWSFAVALALSVLVWVACMRNLPVGRCGKAPFGYANLIALLVAVAITVAQQLLADHRSPGALLNALIIGLIAGLASPHIGALLRGKARTA